MTSAHPTKPQPPLLQSHHLASGEMASEATWPVATRALLLLAEAVHPADPALARFTDEDLALLRVALLRLNSIEPTSAA